MNLRELARGAITTVNPDYEAELMHSTGYTTDAAGKQTPTYDTVTLPIQIQALSSSLQKINNLNQQGISRSVFLNGFWAGVIRDNKQGGDLFKFPEYPGGEIKTWLVTSVVEAWPDWCHVTVTMQVDA